MAKLDIASDSDSEGRGFKSLRAGHQIKRSITMITLYGIGCIIFGISYFFGSFCPSLERFVDKVKSTFFQSSDKKNDSPEKKESVPKKVYNIAKGTGESVLKLLDVAKEGFITSYITCGTTMDKNGEIKFWNWFEEAKKIHKGVKSGNIFNEKSIARMPEDDKDDKEVAKVQEVTGNVDASGTIDEVENPELNDQLIENKKIKQKEITNDVTQIINLEQNNKIVAEQLA